MSVESCPKFVTLYHNSKLNNQIIEVRNGNILSENMTYDLNYTKPDYHRWVVIPVNTLGVLNSGLARTWKEHVGPESDMVKAYKDCCERKILKPGGWIKYRYNTALSYLLAATKGDYRIDSKSSDVESIVEKLAKALSVCKDSITLHTPALGCGLGNLNYEAEVKPLMLRYFSAVLDRVIYIYR